MLDFQGRIIENKDDARILISDLKDDDAMVEGTQASSIETVLIDKCVISPNEPSSY